MKKSRHTEEQIIGILKEAEAGVAVIEICRKYGISDQTYYNWKAKYGGMSVSHARNISEDYRIDYNNERPHSSLGDLTLAEFMKLEEGKAVGIL